MKKNVVVNRKKQKFYRDWLFALPIGDYSLKSLVTHAGVSATTIVRTMRNLGIKSYYIKNKQSGRLEAVYEWGGTDTLTKCHPPEAA